MMRALVKFPLISTLMVLFLLSGATIKVLISNRWSARLVQRLAMATSKIALFILGVRIRSTSMEGLQSTAGSLIVSNHLSYLDILVFASIREVTFVTSVEIRDTPVLGWMSRTAGCKFVERRSREFINQEIECLRNAMLSGQSIVLFPEATSTDGRTVKPFKISMFGSVEGTGIMVYPCAIRYNIRGSFPMDRIAQDAIHWYGSMRFFPHLWRMCMIKRIYAQVEVMPPHSALTHSTRNELADVCHQDILKRYHSMSHSGMLWDAAVRTHGITLTS